MVALAGNRAALAVGHRYLVRDLNRSWAIRGPGLVPSEGGTRPSEPEDQEQAELLTAIDHAVAHARGPVFFLDLHTTSGPGEPFSTVMDSLRSRRFALGVPVPLIVGLGDLLEGTLLEYLADRGIPGMVFEGGKRDSSMALENSEAGIWSALASARLIQEGGFPEVRESLDHLRRETRGLSDALELCYRHALTPDDGFQMSQGFRSFQQVREGQVVATDRRGPIRAPFGGRLLMPLYQEQGEDGFFLVREFRPFWLGLSELLRRIRADRILPLIPGFARGRPDGLGLVVNRKRVGRLATETLHLLGYRRKIEEEGRLRFIKPPDGGLTGPR